MRGDRYKIQEFLYPILNQLVSLSKISFCRSLCGGGAFPFKAYFSSCSFLSLHDCENAKFSFNPNGNDLSQYIPWQRISQVNHIYCKQSFPFIPNSLPFSFINCLLIFRNMVKLLRSCGYWHSLCPSLFRRCQSRSFSFSLKRIIFSLFFMTPIFLS